MGVGQTGPLKPGWDSLVLDLSGNTKYKSPGRNVVQRYWIGADFRAGTNFPVPADRRVGTEEYLIVYRHEAFRCGLGRKHSVFTNFGVVPAGRLEVHHHKIREHDMIADKHERAENHPFTYACWTCDDSRGVNQRDAFDAARFHPLEAVFLSFDR
jgi:hypothetical protein